MVIRRLTGALALVVACGSWAGGEDADPRILAAREDLAKRMKVPLERVEVVSETSMTWPNTAMGCERKGVMYAQVLTPGYKLVLNVAGQKHYYHAKKDAPYEYCVTPNTKKTGPVKAPVM